MATINISEAGAQHINTIADCWQSIDQCSPHQPFGDIAIEKRQRAQELIKHAIDSTDALVFIATTAQEIIGTISGHIYQRPASERSQVGVIYSLWVNQGQRRQGVGQALLSHIEQHLHGMGAQALQVGWDTQNTVAIEWWHKRGYAPYETIACKILE